MPVLVVERFPHLRCGNFSACIGLYTPVGNTFIALADVQRFVKLRNIDMPQEVLKIFVLIQLGAVHKDLTDLLAYGIMKIL